MRDIFKKYFSGKNLLLLAAVGFIIKLLIFVFIAQKASWGSKKEVKFAVINTLSLIELHPLNPKLKQTEMKITKLQDRIMQGPSGIGELRNQFILRIRTLHQKIKDELDQDMAEAKKEVETQQKALKEKLTALNAETRKALEKIKDNTQDAGLPQIKTSKDKKQNIIKELLELKNRQVDAKRLELQKELKDDLENAKKNKDAKYSEYETKVLKETQDQKINLQFKYNMAQDKDERDKLKEMLDSIERQEKQKLSDFSVELEKDYKKYESAQNNLVQKKLIEFQSSLDKNIKDQLSGKDSSAIASATISPERKKIIENYNAVSRQINAQMQKIQTESMKKFEEKRLRLMDQLKKEQANISDKSNKEKDYLDKYNQKFLQENKKELDNLTKERDGLLNAIVSDINTASEKVAKKERLSAVFTTFLVNVKCRDITDLVKEEMKKNK